MQVAKPPSARRRRSRQLLLEAIRRENGVTRSELGRITGLSRSAVAETVQDLLAARLVVENQRTPGGSGAGRGRPAGVLVARPDAGRVVGIDFGHEHVAIALAGTDGEVVAEQRLDLAVDGRPDDALGVATQVLSRLLARHEVPAAEIRAVAAGLPAPLDLRSHRVRPRSVLSAWQDRDVEGELAARLGRPVRLSNDAELGALGELRFGAARGLRDFVYVKASEGIGAAVFINGSVHRGSAGLAGEIGHLRLGDAGQWCRCGNRGCLETVLSSNLLAPRLRERFGPPTDRVHPLAAHAADPVIAAFVTEAGRTLGRVLADLCNWIDPAAIVLGGVLGTAGAPLVDGVRESVSRYTSPDLAAGLDVRTAALGLRSELMGAVAVAIQDALHLPDPAA